MISSLPRIIQGGMGIGVSQWPLARAVSIEGELGLVSLVGIPFVVARQLQDGDEGGHLRRALSHFPSQEVASRVLDRYYLPGGRAPGQGYRPTPFYSADPSQELNELLTCAAFSHVWLAKEGHDGFVGVNTVEKIQLPHLPVLFGSMLAGVDVVVIGAGVPAQIPGVLDKLSRCEALAYELTVHGAPSGSRFEVRFDPRTMLGGKEVSLQRPAFFPIVSSVLLADMLLGPAGDGGIDAFVVEGHVAGGHNAPPRGRMKYNEKGEPLYGRRDEVNFTRMQRLGKPFYWAGGCAEPGLIREALDHGAAGIQIGTMFGLADESSFRDDVKATARKMAFRGELEVLTDARASSTGFPFKVAQVPGTLSDKDLYAARHRVCDMGMSRDLYLQEDGSIGYACAGGPVDRFGRISGHPEETEGRKCLCHGLSAAIGLQQTHKDGTVEPPLITLGKDTSFAKHIMRHEDDSFTVKDTIEYLRKLMGD